MSDIIPSTNNLNKLSDFFFFHEIAITTVTHKICIYSNFYTQIANFDSLRNINLSFFTREYNFTDKIVVQNCFSIVVIYSCFYIKNNNTTLNENNRLAIITWP